MNNTEAKQEAIKKAYGEFWETVKNYVDENGYLDKQVFSNYKGITYEEISSILFLHNTLTTCIPLSLQGIENNNGWIIIESEADLPKLKSAEELNCFIKASDDERIGMGIFAFGRFMTFFGNEYANVTHYQPIEKPKPPIY